MAIAHYLCIMQISEAEVGQLFANSPLLGLADVEVLVAFAKDYIPEPGETALLSNILVKGYGCSLARVHYFYFFEEENQEDFHAQIQLFHPGLVLIFDPSRPALTQAQSGESELIYLPDLGKIEQNLAIKKDIWAILKQLQRA